jgi:hypothetical protein
MTWANTPQDMIGFGLFSTRASGWSMTRSLPRRVFRFLRSSRGSFATSSAPFLRQA